MDYEKLPDDSSISFLSLHGSVFSFFFSEGHNAAMFKIGIVFSATVLMQYLLWTEISGLQKKKIVITLVDSHVLLTEDESKLQYLDIILGNYLKTLCDY